MILNVSMMNNKGPETFNQREKLSRSDSLGSENSHNGIAVDQMSQQQQHHKPKFLQELGSPGLDVTGLMSKETEGGLTESDPRYRLRIIGMDRLGNGDNLVTEEGRLLTNNDVSRYNYLTTVEDEPYSPQFPVIANRSSRNQLDAKAEEPLISLRLHIPKQAFEESKSPPNTEPVGSNPNLSARRREAVVVPPSDGNSPDFKKKKLRAVSKLIMARSNFKVAGRVLTRDLRLTPDEFELFNDKAHIHSQHAIFQENSEGKALLQKKKPKLRMLLEKHQVIQEDVTREFISRMLDKITQEKKTWQVRFVEKLRQIKKRSLDFGHDAIRYCKGLYKPIHPAGRLRTIWDIISIIFTFYEAVFLPFRVGFDYGVKDSLLVFELFKDFFFFLEIFLNFHTGFISKGVYIDSHRPIAQRYLRGWFFFDIIANSPWTELIAVASSNLEDYGQEDFGAKGYQFAAFLKLFRVLKIAKIRKHFSKLHFFIESEFNNALMSLMKLLFYVIFLAHLIACLWHFVGLLSLQNNANSWILDARIENSSLTEKYLTSLYWATTTMLTVGYGDITSQNMFEKLINIFIMLCGCGMFAYTMNSIGIILQNINYEVSKKRQQYQLVNKFLKRNELSKDTQTRAIEYLDYLFQNRKETISEEANALALLSNHLQSDIKKEMNSKILRSNVIFKANFGTTFLFTVSTFLQEKILSPNELIFDEDDDKFAMYFISAGTIELYYTHLKKKLRTLGKNECFGEISFFTNAKRTIAARSATFCNLFYINKEDFICLFGKHTAEKEIYHCIKDKVELYQDYSALKLKCHICSNEGHGANYCPNLHLVPNVEEVVNSHLKEFEKFKRSYKRGWHRKRFHAVIGQNYVALKAEKFCIDKPETVGGFLGIKIMRLNSQRLRKTSTSITLPNSPKAKDKEVKTLFFAQDNEMDMDLDLNFPRIGSSPSLHNAKETQVAQYSFTSDVDSPLDRKGANVNNETVIYYKNGVERFRIPYYQKHSPMEDDFVFDSVKNYRFYFPKNNITKIIENIDSQAQARKKLEEMKNQVEDMKSELGKVFTNPQLPKVPSQLSKRGSLFEDFRRSIRTPPNLRVHGTSVDAESANFSERVRRLEDSSNPGSEVASSHLQVCRINKSQGASPAQSDFSLEELKIVPHNDITKMRRQSKSFTNSVFKQVPH